MAYRYQSYQSGIEILLRKMLPGYNGQRINRTKVELKFVTTKWTKVEKTVSIVPKWN